ncbi:hypothetical protein BABA_17402 [Neobacillus bataviensis LMG 21833]|uniref:Uncharacterized protein n=1 Tax=Neobacillus bataviensis LMG 21833 TaxID=1117379 RepID=K6D0Q5_9BACI|nr:hypothetical protein [Neobacillus bataviensis]EKN66042.1 hypothetical protein BABA_17402 [Neobacillus bataviensis LMG 21833]
MSDIVKMKKEIEELSADRVSRGLPPSPPDNFVSPEVGFILFERCKPLFDILVKYAKLCDEAQAILPIDVSKFDSYTDDLVLLGRTVGNGGMAFAVGLKGAIMTIKSPGGKSPDHYVRVLLNYLQIAGLEVKHVISTFAYNYKLDDSEQKLLMEKVHTNYELYKSDEAVLNAELKRLKEHYESIKHLY